MSNVPALSVMAFDFGMRRIGVAVGDTSIGVAHALTTLHVESRAEQLAAITPLVAEWQPKHFVVGQPKHADGSPHVIAQAAKKLGNRLTENFRIPVAYVDETLSSSEASAQLREQGITGRDQQTHLDSLAAQLILQSWLDDYRQTHAKGMTHAA